MSELHNDAEAFVHCALADDTSGEQCRNQEIGRFILALILAHKKRHYNDVFCCKPDCICKIVKIEQVVPSSYFCDPVSIP